MICLNHNSVKISNNCSKILQRKLKAIVEEVELNEEMLYTSSGNEIIECVP